MSEQRENINNGSVNSKTLLSLLQLSDPALPIGGFAHSAGLETYVQEGIVHDKVSARDFVETMLQRNLQFTDAAFLSLAYDASVSNSIEELITLDEECTAVKIPMEMRQASQKMGMRLYKIFQPVCGTKLGEAYQGSVQQGHAAGHYSLWFGLFAAVLGIKKKEALTGFYYNAAAGMTTNCVKLVPLSQQSGQELLFSLHPLISQLAVQSMQPDRELLGLCCSGFDIRSMQHERLYSRLYMS